MYKVYDVNMEDVHVQSHAEGDRVHLLPIIYSITIYGTQTWVLISEDGCPQVMLQMGYGIWDTGRGIWDTGYGIRAHLYLNLKASMILRWKMIY